MFGCTLMSVGRAVVLRAVWSNPELSTGVTVGERCEKYAKPELYRWTAIHRRFHFSKFFRENDGRAEQAETSDHLWDIPGRLRLAGRASGLLMIS